MEAFSRLGYIGESFFFLFSFRANIKGNCYMLSK
jgi:hypothetical protein